MGHGATAKKSAVVESLRIVYCSEGAPTFVDMQMRTVPGLAGRGLNVTVAVLLDVYGSNSVPVTHGGGGGGGWRCLTLAGGLARPWPCPPSNQA